MRSTGVVVADWPRAIKPEDRIKYLIDARHTFKETVSWSRDKDGSMRASTWDEEYLLIVPDKKPRYETPEISGGVKAYYQVGENEELLIGEFDSSWEARKALTDHAVVQAAIRQAWEDVAT